MLWVKGPFSSDNMKALMADLGEDESFSVDISELFWQDYAIDCCLGIKQVYILSIME